MRKNYIRWLDAELPDLVGKNILSADAAARLRRYYEGYGRQGQRRIITNAFGILAAVLIGSGLILLFAHNWDSLSREIRAVISFIPLIIAQVLAGWGIWREKGSPAWREGTAIFLMLSVGVALALISQTYHLSHDPDTFTLSWMLLSVPLVYLLRAGTVVPLYLAGIVVWTAITKTRGGYSELFWLWLVLPAPYIWLTGKKDLYRLGPAILRGAFVLAFSIGTLIILERALPRYGTVLIGSLAAIIYLGGKIWFAEAPPRVFLRPLRGLGAAGVFWVSLFATFEFFWEGANRGGGYILSPLETVFTIALPLAAVCLLFLCLRRRKGSGALLGAAPILAVAGTFMIELDCPILVVTILFNAYLFVLGLTNLIAGVRERTVGSINLGMLILGTLILVRFFDSDLSFVARGIAFIAIGVCFLATNYILLKKK